jgi:IMP dehydrogenase
MMGDPIQAFLGGGSPPSFDDVMIVPTYSEIRSRKEPDTKSFVTNNIELEVPIISSPMDTVTGAKMAFTMGSNGGLGILHRFMPKEEQALAVEDILRSNAEITGLKLAKIVPAIGIGRSEKQRFNYLYERFKDSLSAVAIDIANGDSSYMIEMIKWVDQKTSGNIPIIAGNVATGEGFIRLAEAGASAIRVGIGGGSICKTRIMTGIGVPTLASVIDCYSARGSDGGYDDVSIIADGGIRYPADFVKSLAAGADAVIAGRIFAGTIESPGEVISLDGRRVKVYRGMASKEVQDDKRGGLKPGTCAEGVSTHIPLKGKAYYILDEFCGGLRSAMTYTNSYNLSDLRNNSRFIKLTPSALDESHAFGTRK